jgi:hypothetical protein
VSTQLGSSVAKVHENDQRHHHELRTITLIFLFPNPLNAYHSGRAV